MRQLAYSLNPTERVNFTVAASLENLDRALQMVGASCKLVSDSPEFEREVVSAFGEAFHLVAIHSYAGRLGRAEVVIENYPDRITVHLNDQGAGVDFNPDASLGAFIVRSLMDEVSYSRGPGSRNCLSMTRYLR